MTDFHDHLDALMRGDLLEEKNILTAERQAFEFPTARPQWAPPRHYDIDLLVVDWKVNIASERVDAISKIKLTSIVPRLSEVFLHALDLDVSSVTDSTGEPLEFELNPEEESIIVRLARPLTKGESQELIFAYTIESPRVGLHFTNPCPEFPDVESSFWTQMQDDYCRACVPVYDNPSHKFPTESIITVPRGYFAMGNGYLKERTENNDGTVTFHWVQEKPIPAYLMTMTASEYVEYKEDLDGLEVSYYAHKKWDKDTVFRSFGKTPAMIRFFESKLGVKFPWAKYAQVTAANFVIGGMENVSATTQTDVTLHEEKVHKDYQSDWLVAHELAHQWFGDLVTCRTWSHGWLNEGAGTQFQNEWKLQDLGYDEYLYDQYGKQKSYFEEDKNQYRRPIVHNRWERGSDMFDRHLYPGAAWRYYMLKHLVGEERWWEIMGEWLRRFSYKSPYTHDMEALFTEITGEDYGWFFEQWLYKAGYPECKISCSYDSKLGHAHVKIEQTQKHDDGMTPEVFRFPLTVEIVLPEERLRYTMDVNERVHNFYFPIVNKPKQILIDPDYAVLMDWDITKPEPMWLEQLGHGETVIQRIKAAQALGKKPNHRILQALGEALVNDGFWGVQVEIAKVLGDIKSSSALEQLLRGINLEDSRARTAVATALGNFYQNERALEALKKLLEDQESFFVVAAAATSIGKLKHEDSFGILKDGLERAQGSWTEIVRRGYLSGLKETGKAEAIPIISKYVEPGNDDYLRRTAPRLLAVLGKAHKKKHPQIRDVIERLLHDKSYRVTIAAIGAAKEYGDVRLIPALRKLAEGHVDSGIVRMARVAIRALSKKKDATEIKSLQKSVEEIEQENRELKDRISKIEAHVLKESNE